MKKIKPIEIRDGIIEQTIEEKLEVLRLKINEIVGVLNELPRNI